VEGLIGFFVNTLALRGDIAGNPTFRELLARVREATLEAYAHQEVPFERLVDALDAERALSHAPVFQVMLTVQNTDSSAPELAGLGVEAVRTTAGTSKFDLMLAVAERAGVLRGVVEYAADLFDASTVQALLARMERLLAAFAAAPETRVSEVPLTDEAERARMLVEWNDTAAVVPAHPVHHQVAARAAESPDAPAVTGAGETLTYAALEARAEAIAVRLRALDAGPETVVALAMERGPALVAAILGTWKAGAAYLPIDPTHPAERVTGMLADAGAAALVANHASSALLPTIAIPRLVIEEIGEIDGPASPATDAPSADALAYVLFTSGSTGRPKGVMVPHGAVANFLSSMQRAPGIAAGDTLLSVTTPTFDISVLEMFLPLVTGAHVVIAGRDEAADAGRLCATLAREGATVMQATPATWRMLLDSGWSPEPGMKVLCGGEPLPPEMAVALAGQAELWNLYGPTETTVWSTAERVLPGAPVTIGRPIANTRVYVLDAALGVVPPGVAGELYISGAGVARGYCGRPALSAERFLPDPFSTVPGARMYRTGDRARWRADARLECLGRTDQQVKVRGFRIEPGEVEAALEQVEGVSRAVVVARPDAGGAYLAAYVVPAAGAPAPDGAALGAALRRTLPEYMVPARWAVLDTLPLTPSGKVDRKALPAPATTSEWVYVAPRTPVEETIATVWAQVLGVERVGVHEGFFALGGHSLLAMRAMSRLAAATGVELAVRDLFVHPTVAELAPRLEDQMLARLVELGGEELDALLEGTGAGGELPAVGIHHEPLD
jgi:amino acid adenylation domain-containing protein